MDTFNSISRPSIIIVAWNNSVHLHRSLDCLTRQTIKPAEIIIVNNASDDLAMGELSNRWPELTLTIIDLPENGGFAKANNIGAKIAKSSWLALLNADAFPEEDWLEMLIKAAEENPKYSFFSSKQIQAIAPELLDGAGDSYHVSGLAWRNFYNFSSEKYGHDQREVFSACAAAALISRQEFLEVGGFDEDYFSYFEDVDLGFRLRLAGKKCLYVPGAVVYHMGSASTGKGSDFSIYHGYRNLIWAFVKNMPFPLFWLFLPLHIAVVAFFVAYFSIRGQGRVILKAIIDAIWGLPKVLRKRKEIQGKNKIRSNELLEMMSINIPEPFREFIARKRSR